MVFDLQLPGRHLDAPDYVELSSLAEQRGWKAVWLGELLSYEAFSVMTAIGCTTKRVELGTAIVPIASRSPALIAMEAFTISRLTSRPLHVGLGVSTPSILGKRHGRHISRPLAEMRGNIDVIRRSLAGESVSSDEPAVENFRLPAAVENVRILVAAVGPQMIDLSYEHGDGVILSLVSTRESARVAGLARESSTRSDFETTGVFRVAVEPDADDRLSAKREIASYCRVPVFRDAIQRMDWDISAVIEAESTDDACDALPENLFEEMVIMGSAADCRERLQELTDLGVRPLVMPVSDRANLMAMSRRVVDELGD